MKWFFWRKFCSIIGKAPLLLELEHNAFRNFRVCQLLQIKGIYITGFLFYKKVFAVAIAPFQRNHYGTEYYYQILLLAVFTGNVTNDLVENSFLLIFMLNVK